MILENKNNINIQYLTYLLLCIPLFLISGPFLTDLIVVIFSIFFLVNFQKFVFEKKFKYFLVTFIIFYILINISSFLSDHIIISLKSSFFYFRFIFFAIVIAILIQNLRNNFKFLKLFNNLFFAIITFFFIDSLFQFVYGNNLFGQSVVGQLEKERVSSVFGKELILGSFISKIMFIFLGLFNLQNKLIKNKYYNYKTIYIISLCILIILMSGERAALVMSLLGTLIYLIITKNFKTILIIFTIIIVFFSIINLSKDSKKRYLLKYKVLYDTIFVYKQLGSSTHVNHFKTAFKMYEDKKLFGHGIKSFRNKCNLEKYSGKTTSCSTHPHNYYIQVLASTGTLTFICLSILFLFLTHQLFICLKKSYIKNYLDKEKISYLISSFLAIFPLTTTGSFFNNWISATIFLSFGFLVSTYDVIFYKSKFTTKKI